MAYHRIYNRQARILEYIRNNSRPTTKDILKFLHREGEVVDARTVQRDIKTIENELDYVIIRKGTHPNKWYEIEEEPDELTLVSRSLQHVHLAGLLREEAKLEKRQRRAVFLDDAQLTRGLEHFSVLLSAIRARKKVRITHRKFGYEETIRVVSPLFLKQFGPRWYIVAKENETEIRKTFGLDRITSVEKMDEEFGFSEDDDHDQLFGHVIGLYQNEEEPITIRIWSEKEHAGYLRSVKLHSSQQELFEEDGGVVFEIQVVPNYEFFQQLLKMEATVKVLDPENVVNQFKRIVSSILEVYE